jgi:LacI family transcriptional regulator
MPKCVNLLSICDTDHCRLGGISSASAANGSRFMSKAIVRIGLVMTHSLGFYRSILRGVKAFAVERPDWVFTPIAPEAEAIELARSLHCDGYIAHVFTRSLADILLARRRPVVSVAGVLSDVPLPRVAVDHVEVGRQAAHHMLERGVRQFGFVGYAELEFSVQREQGFREVVEAAGFDVETFREKPHRVADPTGLWMWNQPLMKWLASLPKPVGVLASNDVQAAQVSEFCRQLKLLVPEQIAIVGVDDDDLLCELSRPSLSSVAVPGERIGYEAALLLDKWLRGSLPSKVAVVLPPAGVVARQSSDLIAIPDPLAAAALRFIQNSAHKNIHVDDVLREVPIARRTLERSFRKWLRRSISDEIRRVHLERGKQLLLATDLPIAAVADMSGFHDGRQLSILFRRATGMTPSAFRRRYRLRSV